MTDPDRWRPLFSKDHHVVRIDRVWKTIKPELLRHNASRQHNVSKGWIVAIGVSAAAVAAILLFFLRPLSADKPLATDSDDPIPLGIFSPETTIRRFSDGSRLEVSDGAAISLLENSGTTVRFSLEKGRARFIVTPGGPRLWQVVAGDISVTVLGTIFIVEKDASHVGVSVERGAVSVRGAGVTDGGVRLAAGQSISIAFAETPVSSHPLSTPLKQAGSETAAPPSEEKRPAIRKREWKQKAESGNYTEAFAELGASGVAALARQTRDIDELFQLADVARFSGHTSDAVAPLSAIVERSSDKGKAGLAAYTLGRLYMGQLSMPEKAIPWLDKALALGIPTALEEAVMANRIRALLMLDDTRWSALAKAYFERYPTGRYRRQIETWINRSDETQ